MQEVVSVLRIKRTWVGRLEKKQLTLTHLLIGHSSVASHEATTVDSAAPSWSIMASTA